MKIPELTTEKTRLKRLPYRGHYDTETINGILDAGLLCHVGYEVDGHPFVTPTLYWREGGSVYWHGAASGRFQKSLSAGMDVCFTVSLLDGLVFARSAFHHSANYRSVMAFGRSVPVLDEREKTRQLEMFMDRLATGRWSSLRPMTKRELRLTTVMSLKLEEAVAKVRTGKPVDDEEDYAYPVWAGVVPLLRHTGTPEDDGRLMPGVEVPPGIGTGSFPLS